jgi:hypothetical protein
MCENGRTRLMSETRYSSRSLHTRGMVATTPQTPRRSKRHHPVVFTTANPSSLSQAGHDKWASPPLHTRSTTSLDLVDDEEESTADATTTFYSDFLRSASGRSGKGPSEKYSIGDTVLLATSVQKPSIGVIVALWEVSRHVAHSQMFVNIHWFLRPAELARTRTKREHLEVRIPTSSMSVNLQMIFRTRMRSIYPLMQLRSSTFLPYSPIVTLRPPQEKVKSPPLRDINPMSQPWQIVSSASMQ